MTRTTVLSLCFLLLAGQVRSQGSFCSPQGNVVLFSNYDGGPLIINVDQNIPDLFIGVVSYEFTKISIVGPFAANVTQVVYAGYNGTNDPCNLGTSATTSVTGVPSNLVSILFAPSVSFPNSNGYGNVICGYSCDVNTNQGGCNTADQVAHYFLFNYGGILRSHVTQYACWQGVQNLSAGGNCCEDPLSTGIAALAAPPANELRLDRAGDLLTVHTSRAALVIDASGRTVCSLAGTPEGRSRIDTSTWPVGAYVLREQEGSGYARFIVAR
jgi:hypothetical protein